jgi:hypothetical protein
MAQRAGILEGMRRYTGTVGVMALAMVAGCQSDDGIRMPTELDASADEPVVPEERLAEMAEFIGSHSAFGFEAFVTYEALQDSGQKLRFDLVQSIAVHQPAELWWMTLRDDGSTDTAWFSDGVFTMLKQPENIYGQVDRLGTITEMIDVLTNDYGLVVPFSDFLRSSDEPVLLEKLDSTFDAGLAWVVGKWTDHLALRNELVDFEVWIQRDGDPIPQKIAITWKLEDGLPSFVARLRNWKFSASTDGSKFQFVAPSDAELIEIIPASPVVQEGI